MPLSPDIIELIKDPRKRAALTTPQMYLLVKKLEQVTKDMGLKRPGVPDSPAGLAEKFSRGKWQRAAHLDLINGKLMEVEGGKKPFLMINMPPRHGKSELTSYWFPLWLLARDPSRRIVVAGYSDSFARRWGLKVRRAIFEHGDKMGLSLSDDSASADNWELTAGGGMRTVGAGGSLTGLGADFLIIDDAVKDEEAAASEVLRDKVWDWWQTVAYTRLEPGGSVVAIGTRWHQDDLLGRLEAASELVKQQQEGKEVLTEDDIGVVWDVLKLPAFAENGDVMGRALGDPLWPARYSKDALILKKKGISPYHWSALYQQRPTPEEGGAIKRAWWQRYTVPPAEFDQIIQSWDLAFKDLAKSDFTVGQVWGRRGAQFFLLHQVRARMNAPEMIAAIRNLWKLYPKATAKLIEDRANGPAIVALLRKEIPGVIPVPVKASKDARLSAVAPLIEAGNVYIPSEITHPWIPEFIEECAQFPQGTHDDQLDAMVHALTYLQPAGWRQIARDWKEARLGPPPTTTEQLQVRAFSLRIKKDLKKAEKRAAVSQRGMLWGGQRQRVW